MLFGETEDESCRRLRQMELDEPEKVEGIRNDFKYGLKFNKIFCKLLNFVDFLARDAMNKVDEVYLQEVLKNQGTAEEEKRSKYDVQLYESDTTFDSLLDMANDINRGDNQVDFKVIAEFIKVMLRFWGEELNARDEAVKMSIKGKIEAGTYAQTRFGLT